MALKPTIYKCNLNLSDIDNGHYDSLSLTLALHPSETLERMAARLLAYCFSADTRLGFTKGLSASEEPDIWAHSLDGQMTRWIDVGEPSPDRIKKASRLCPLVEVYSFNTKSDTWWQQNSVKFSEIPANFHQFSSQSIKQFSALIKRTMDLSVTISDKAAFIATDEGTCEIQCEPLQMR